MQDWSYLIFVVGYDKKPAWGYKWNSCTVLDLAPETSKEYIEEFREDFHLEFKQEKYP